MLSKPGSTPSTMIKTDLMILASRWCRCHLDIFGQPCKFRLPTHDNGKSAVSIICLFFFFFYSRNTCNAYDENLCIVILSQIAHASLTNQRPKLGRAGKSGVTRHYIIFSLRLHSFPAWLFGLLILTLEFRLTWTKV